MATLNSRFERHAARVLTRFPYLKPKLKRFYQLLVYWFFKKKRMCETEYSIGRVSDHGSENFYGYFDKTPDCGGKILYYSSEMDTKKAHQIGGKVCLNVRDLDINSDITSIEVNCYNLQQGGRAQWLNNDMFIFNHFCEDKNMFVSRVFSISLGKEVKRYDYPVQDSFRSYFLSINYKRLMSLSSDYGYINCGRMSEEELRTISNDGIWRICLDTGNEELLISLSQIVNYIPKAIFKESLHTVNHVMISPNGREFIFHHRYYSRFGKSERLFKADSRTGQLELIADYGMVSHCSWLTENTIIGYLRGPNGKDGYWIIELNKKDFKQFAGGKLDVFGDGHPNVRGEYFVTDTYPDRGRRQHLLLCNWRTGSIEKLGDFYHGFAFQGDARCDLHPRFSEDGRRIYFDSVFEGIRKLYFLQLDS